MIDARKKQLLRIYRSRSIGPISFYSLYVKHKNPYDMMAELKNKGINLISEEEIENEIYRTEEFGAQIIFFEDPEYPQILRECRDAPVFLVAKGNIKLLNTECISIVGSRNSSLHGNRLTLDLAQQLEDCGYTIVSGMAYGIDRHAHLGAKKNTIAVIANGISHVYPPENRDIYDRICETGLVITEQPITQKDRIANLFHARNRIIAGICKGLVVVEATKNSGSLITAECALEYNKDIFAVPGFPLDQRSYGTNTLIQQGAYLIKNTQDIIKNLHKPELAPADETAEIFAEDIDPKLAKNILSLLSTIPVHVDELYSILKCQVSEIKSILIELEMQGLVKHVLGGKVVRI